MSSRVCSEVQCLMFSHNLAYSTTWWIIFHIISNKWVSSLSRRPHTSRLARSCSNPKLLVNSVAKSSTAPASCFQRCIVSCTAFGVRYVHAKHWTTRYIQFCGGHYQFESESGVFVIFITFDIITKSRFIL